MAEDKINILIVDDVKNNLIALENLLEQPHLSIYKAENGNDALSQMLHNNFALVLLDVQMPSMDGFEVAELMRGREKTKDIPIIFLTAINKEQKYVFKGYEAGAVDYIFKPIDPIILISKVKVFCSLYQQRQIIQGQLEEISKKKDMLEQQFEELKVLRGLLPICAKCKKIKDDEGYWEHLEVYIQEHSEAEFSHSLCPTCAKELYPKYFKGKP